MGETHMTDLFNFMPAITLHQPWASLVEAGSKPYETRHWRASPRFVGQRIAIHAASRPIITKLQDDVLDAITEALGGPSWHHALPRGAVLCTAILASVHSTDDVEADPFGNYAPGRWAWRLTDIRPVTPHAPARGGQGWWRWQAPAGLAL